MKKNYKFTSALKSTQPQMGIRINPWKVKVTGMILTSPSTKCWLVHKSMVTHTMCPMSPMSNCPDIRVEMLWDLKLMEWHKIIKNWLM